MRILSQTDGLKGLIPAGTPLVVTLVEPAGRVTKKETVLHRATFPKDLDYDTAFVAELDRDECAALGLRSGIGGFFGKSAVA